MNSQRLEFLTTGALLAALAGAFAMPAARWPTALALLAVVVALFSQGRLETAADRQRRAKRWWLAPSVVLAVAVQLVVAASAEQRARMVILSGVLLLAALALAWRRRHRA